MRSAAAFVTDVSLNVIVRLDSMLQRCLRDMYAGAGHLMVSDVAYEHYGQALLGLPDVNVMG